MEFLKIDSTLVLANRVFENIIYAQQWTVKDCSWDDVDCEHCFNSSTFD